MFAKDAATASRDSRCSKCWRVSIGLPQRKNAYYFSPFHIFMCIWFAAKVWHGCFFRKFLGYSALFCDEWHDKMKAFPFLFYYLQELHYL